MGIRWTAWGTSVTVRVTQARALPSAYRLVRECVVDAERAADLDRRSEITRLMRAAGRPHRIGPTLSAFVAVALDAAQESAGAVDPTVAAGTMPLRRMMRAADRHRAGATDGLFPVCAGPTTLRPRPAPGWNCVTWSEHTVAVPATVGLDVTATAKARTARLAASRVAERLGVGVLVDLGGDVATAGPAPTGGWIVVPEHWNESIEIPGGTSVSVCRARTVVDPLTGRAVAQPDRTVLVRDADVVRAKTAAVTALVRGGTGHDGTGRTSAASVRS